MMIQHIKNMMESLSMATLYQVQDSYVCFNQSKAMQTLDTSLDMDIWWPIRAG